MNAVKGSYRDSLCDYYTENLSLSRRYSMKKSMVMISIQVGSR